MSNQLTDDKFDALRSLGSFGWRVLIQLYAAEKEGVSSEESYVRGLARTLDAPVPQVSLAVARLKSAGLALDIGPLREGRKYFKLSEGGVKIAAAVSSVFGGWKEARLPAPDHELLGVLVKKAKGEPSSSREIGREELLRLARRSLVWEERAVRSLIEGFLLSEDADSVDWALMILSIVTTNANKTGNASSLEDDSNLVKQLKQILQDGTGWSGVKEKAAVCLDNILPPIERLGTYFGIWQEGAKEIRDEQVYVDFAFKLSRHFSPFLGGQRKELVSRLLKASKDPGIGKRAVVFHEVLGQTSPRLGS